MASCQSSDHRLHATCLQSPLIDTSLVPLTATYPTSNTALYSHKLSTVRWDSTIKYKPTAILHAPQLSNLTAKYLGTVAFVTGLCELQRLSQELYGYALRAAFNGNFS